jgi:hypothetical protein
MLKTNFNAIVLYYYLYNSSVGSHCFDQRSTEPVLEFSKGVVFSPVKERANDIRSKFLNGPMILHTEKKHQIREKTTRSEKKQPDLRKNNTNCVKFKSLKDQTSPDING